MTSIRYKQTLILKREFEIIFGQDEILARWITQWKISSINQNIAVIGGGNSHPLDEFLDSLAVAPISVTSIIFFAYFYHDYWS